MKSEMRKKILSREVLNHKEKSQQIVASIFKLITEKDKSIALFYPTKTEVDILPLIQKLLDLKKTVSLPVITNIKERKMEFKTINNLKELVEDKYKILAPVNGEKITKFDIIIVPCVSVNKDFKRLGMGGGFYDSFLAKTSAKLIAPIFEENAFLDFEDDLWDAIIDIVVTEKSSSFS